MNDTVYISWCPTLSGARDVGARWWWDQSKERLEQIIHEVVDEHNWQIVELAIQPDHVHVFVRSNPYTLPSDIPRRIKGRSLRFLRDEHPPLLKMPSLWTHAYVLSTAGHVSSETIQKYIERQSKA